MLIKINRHTDYKLSAIAEKSGMKKCDVIKGIVDAFINRYECRKGAIIIPDHKPQRRANDIWNMYLIYKMHYFNIFAIEYKVDPKKEKIDMRNLKLIKEKIMQTIIEREKEEIITIDEQGFLDAFEYLLNKMPEWWRTNSFTLSSINKNFEKILKQIENGRKTGKAALDDFLSSFAGGS
jgi:hypothetical protein